MDTLTLIQSSLIVFLVGLLGALLKFGVGKITEWTKELKTDMETLSKNVLDIGYEIREIRKDFERVNGRFEMHENALKSMKKEIEELEKNLEMILTFIEIIRVHKCNREGCAITEALNVFKAR